MTTFSEAEILKISKAKDGDVLLVYSNDSEHRDLMELRVMIKNLTGKNLGVIGLPEGTSLTLLEASEARAILERMTNW